MAFYLLLASILCSLINAQFIYQQGASQQQQYQQQQQLQQQYQQQLQQQYQQQLFQQQHNRRVSPNQFISAINSRRYSGYDSSRVRPKPNYGRVHPDQYVNIIDQQQQQVVYPKHIVQRVVYQRPKQTHRIVYPKQHAIQQTQNRNPYIYVSKKRGTYNPNKRYMPTWPKLRGHCTKPPAINIKGEDPIKKECAKGHVVVLFLMKRRCDFCYHQLRELNKLAVHYQKAGKPLSVVVINHKRGPLSPTLIQRFPGLNFYEEPISDDVFGRLGGAWRQIIVYDVCCRKQYLYGYPFSWMGYSFVRHAIFNTLYYDQVLCGVCKAPPRVNTTVAATTLPVAATTLPVELPPGK